MLFSKSKETMSADIYDAKRDDSRVEKPYEVFADGLLDSYLDMPKDLY